MLALIPAILSVIPEITHLFIGGDVSKGAVADDVCKIAKAITGKATSDDAMSAINADPNLALQFRKAVMDSKVQLEQVAAQRAKDDAQADLDADKALTDRIAELEGTASDLKGIPVLGPIMLFLRGAQRIIIGYGTAFMDYLWLTGGLGAMTEMQSRLLMTASVLVFVVLFGERAIKNVAPLIRDIFEARAGGTQ